MKYRYLTSLIVLLSALSLGFTSCEKLREIGFGKEQQGVVGGYSAPHNLSDEELAIFEQATSGLQGVEYKPMNVATQIVAGVNYRFLCKGKEQERGGKKFYAVIVVHKPLPNAGEPRIISIERQSR